MTRVNATFWWVVPAGKEMDFIAISSRAKKIHMRLGAVNAGLARIQSGQLVGQFTYQMQFASGEDYGKFLDVINTDSEWKALGVDLVKNQTATLSNSVVGTGIDI
jgi:hypothetical protein